MRLKKLLFIIFVSLLVSGNAYAEEVKLNCTGQSMLSGSNENETYVVDLNKKKMHLIQFGPEAAFPIIITNDFFLKYKFEEKISLKGFYEINYREWNRNTGKYIDYLIVLEKKDFNPLLRKLNKENDRIKKAAIYKSFIEEIFPKEPSNPFQFGLYQAECTFN
tara:strand:- start:422 stop:910 length:489 start_codon:yes stop_codon:yes gene_type:complete